MPEKRIYALARYDEPSQERFETCRAALVRAGLTGVQTPNLPHHLTLGSYPAMEETRATELARRIARTSAPFSVRINAMGLFGLRVLFLSPAPCEILTALAHGFFDDPGWCAHTTMLIDERENVLRAIPLLADMFTPFEARVDAIELYEFFPARHIERLPLSGAEV